MCCKDVDSQFLTILQSHDSFRLFAEDTVSYVVGG